MLIFHKNKACIKTSSNGCKNDMKRLKKTYKSAKKCKKQCYSRKTVGRRQTKKSKVNRKKTRTLKKDKQFLETLGLKLKKKKRWTRKQ